MRMPPPCGVPLLALCLAASGGCTVDDLPPYVGHDVFMPQPGDAAFLDQGVVGGDLPIVQDSGAGADMILPFQDAGVPVQASLLAGRWLGEEGIGACIDYISWVSYTLEGVYKEYFLDDDACRTSGPTLNVCQGSVRVHPYKNDGQSRSGRLSASCSGSAAAGPIEAKTLEIPYYIFGSEGQEDEAEPLGLSHYVFGVQEAFVFEQRRSIRYAPKEGQPSLYSQVSTTISFVLEGAEGSWRAENFGQLLQALPPGQTAEFSATWRASVKATVDLVGVREEFDEVVSVPALVRIQEGMLTLQAQSSWQQALEAQGVGTRYRYMSGVLGALMSDELRLDLERPEAWYDPRGGGFKMRQPQCVRQLGQYLELFDGLCE